MTAATTADSGAQPRHAGTDVAAVRHFNRFYTAEIGALGTDHLHSTFGLTEVRVLYELAHRKSPTASDLVAALKLDAGYMSRVLTRFRQLRLVAQKTSASDARARLLALTPLGRRTFAALDVRASHDVEVMLARLSRAERLRVVRAMQTLESLLGERTARPMAYVLRQHRPGDIGWVIERHGALYAQEYGWNTDFEALVAKIAGAFLENLDPARERCWIAERDGERLGCVFLVKKSRAIAQLRLLLVEPGARGLGIGEQLIGECDRFATSVGYRKIGLWTQSNLLAARRLYQRAGYHLVKEERHTSFGAKLVAQDWERDLGVA